MSSGCILSDERDKKGKRRGEAVTRLTATERFPAMCCGDHPSNAPFPARFLVGSRWKVLAKDQKAVGGEKLRDAPLSCLRRASGSEWWVRLQQVAPSVILAPASTHAF